MLTFDLETVPQLRYVDPVDDGVEWDEKWLEDVAANADGRQTTVRAEIAAGNGIVKATGTVPGLHPTTMHIVAASFGGIDRVRGKTVEVAMLRDFGTSDDYADLIDERAEVALLQRCLDRVAWATTEAKPLVTFNGKTADCWWLLIRAMILGLEPRDATRNKVRWRDVFYPYSNDPHLDLRLLLGNSNRFAKGGLSWWSAAFGIEAEESGGEVWSMVRAGEWGRLEAYSIDEGHTLLDFYERVKGWL